MLSEERAKHPVLARRSLHQRERDPSHSLRVTRFSLPSYFGKALANAFILMRGYKVLFFTLF
jgi:hypothetical protein